MALYLLGPPRLELDGEEIHVSRRKAVALLAYLAVTGRGHFAQASLRIRCGGGCAASILG